MKNKYNFLTFVLLCCTSWAFAQPANDDCFGGQTVTPNGTCVNGTTVAATDSWTGLIGCQTGTTNAVHEDVWYQFNATNSSFSTTITAGAGWAGNIEFTLFVGDIFGCLGTFTEVASGCGASPLTVTTTGLTPGTTYYMVVANPTAGTPGAFQICTQNTAPPASCTDNDACVDAAVITLNPSSGAAACVTDCNTGAAPGIDFTGNNCEDMGGPTVWYEFTTDAAAATLDINLTGLTNPEFTIWENTCSPWVNIPGSCTEGTAGAATATVTVSPNTTYIISISDVNGVQGNFTLCLDQNPDNSLCNVNDAMVETASSNPATPVGGPYSPGEVVTFCYTINQWRKEQCNWLQGIVPDFGDCWAPSSFNAQGMPVVTTALVPAGNEAGTWSWYPAGQVVYNNIAGGSLPPNTPLPGGWFFQCNTCGVSNPDPDLSWGDGGAAGAPANDCDINGNGYTWNVCFQLTAGTNTNCTNGTTDCSVSIKTYADGEIGGWTNIGCSGDLPFVLPASFLCCAAPVLSTTSTNVLCNGSSTGSIDLSVSGGVAPYTYSWTGGVLTQDRTGLAAGTYTVTVNEAQGCASITSVTITQPTAVTATTAVTNVLCNGAATGAINLTASGGTGTFTYNWGGGIISEDRTNLTAGTYPVTVTDGNGCTFTTSATITQPTALTVTATTTNILCFGNSTGAINITASGGTGAYTYNWGGGVVTEDRTNIPAGTYTVTVTDANGCTATLSRMLTQPAAALSGTTAVTNVLCNGGNTGAINLTPSGGTGAYTFNWGGGIVTEDRSNLIAGTYTVTVTDANACTFSTSATVTQPTGMTATTAVTNVLCNGAATGAINLTPGGGAGGYTFNWGGGIVTEDRNNVLAGTYTVTVTDASGCTTVTSATVTQPTALTATTTVSNVLCNGGNTGSINLTANGGAGGNTFNWGGGIVTEDRNNLIAGSYTVTVTDVNGCTATTTAVITQPTALTVTATSTNIACFGNSTGAINITASGGTGAYTYNWGAGIVTEDRTNIPAGTYNVTVTDANSCTATLSRTLTQPAAGLTGATTTTASTCGAANGAANLTVAGGTSAYTFLWSNGATTEDLSNVSNNTYTVTITDANSCTATATAVVPLTSNLAATNVATTVTCAGASTGAVDVSITGGTAAFTFIWSNGANTEDITNLSAGIYTVTIIDANSCQITNSATITEPSSVVSASTTQTDVLCNGANTGAIDLTAVGGTGAHSFNWGGGITTEDRSGLVAGTYTATVTDANGCTTTTSATITEPAAALSASTAQTDVLCNGANTGAIDLTAANGTSGYTYNWGGGITTEDRSGLAAGTYTVTVTDANGCTTTASATLAEPTALAVVLDASSDVNCAGGADGSLSLTTSGGTTAYSFDWSNAAITEDLTGLSAGAYALTVTDANGCTATLSATISEPAAIVLTNVVTDVSCNSVNDGAVAVTATGGAAGFSYLWDASAANQTTATATGLSGGNYTITVTDANGCSTTDNFVVAPTQAIDPADVPLVVVTGILDCDLNPIGELGINTTNTYTYLWSNGAATQNAAGLDEGSYTVTITNAAGCTITQTGAVTAPYIPSVNPFIGTVGTTSITVEMGTSVDISGGNDETAQGVTYLWTAATDVVFGNASSHNTTALSDVAGTYVLTITATAGDATGCTDQDTVTLIVEASFEGIPDAFTPNGDGLNDVFRPIGLNADNIIEFKVFDRFGQAIYKGDDLENGGWDGSYKGQDQPREAYMYLLIYQLSASSEVVTLRGEVVLIR